MRWKRVRRRGRYVYIYIYLPPFLPLCASYAARSLLTLTFSNIYIFSVYYTHCSSFPPPFPIGFPPTQSPLCPRSEAFLCEHRQKKEDSGQVSCVFQAQCSATYCSCPFPSERTSAPMCVYACVRHSPAFIFFFFHECVYLTCACGPLIICSLLT